MPVITNAERDAARIEGAAHGTTISLIRQTKLVCIHASPTIIGEWLE